jgi:hypothetical protein
MDKTGKSKLERMKHCKEERMKQERRHEGIEKKRKKEELEKQISEEYSYENLCLQT